MNELYHHGIKGQHWGIRRFQKEDGTLTPEGKKRREQFESAKSDYKKAKKEVNYYRNFGIYDKDSEEKFNKASGMYDLRKKQLSDEKAKQEMRNRTKEASKRENALIEKYKEKGMSQEEAEVAAYKRAKLEKTLAIAAGVTVAAATAYGAKKYHDYVTDEVLKVGKVSMKRVASSDTADVHDTFYAAFGKGDVNKYVGMYGTQKKGMGSKVYQKTIDLKEDIKIASDKNAKNIMADVLRKGNNQQKAYDTVDKMYDDYSKNPLLRNTKQGKALAKGLKDIKNGKLDSKATYDALNIAITNGSDRDVYEEFKSALKAKGYSGVKDRNDSSYSGYNAKTARIIFDSSKVKVSDVRKVSDEEIQSKLGAEVLKMSAKQLAKMSVIATGATMAYNRATRNKENNKAIAEYKKEHPNTKLSNDEILENYYGDK